MSIVQSQLTRDAFAMPVCCIGAGAELLTHLESLQFENLIHRTYDLFSIDDAHELRTLMSSRGADDTCILLTIHSTNTPAQNALLKTLEEYDTISLVMCVSDANTLLDTITSRCFVIDARGEGSAETIIADIDWIAWLSLAPNKRIEHVEKKDISLDALRQVVTLLESRLHTDIRKNHNQLETLQKVREWIGTPQVSSGMILEFLAFAL